MIAVFRAVTGIDSNNWQDCFLWKNQWTLKKLKEARYLKGTEKQKFLYGWTTLEWPELRDHPVQNLKGVKKSVQPVKIPSCEPTSVTYFLYFRS